MPVSDLHSWRDSKMMPTCSPFQVGKAGSEGQSLVFQRRLGFMTLGFHDAGAPALAAANIGIAMGTGTDVAMHTAGITLMRGDPLLIADAIRASRATYRKIWQNLFWAFIFNIIAIPLAATGFLSPAVAGGAMSMSSVAANAWTAASSRWEFSSSLANPGQHVALSCASTRASRS